MPDGLYERDALAWSEQQADLLRRLAAGERIDTIYAKAMKRVRSGRDRSGQPRPLPTKCPFTLHGTLGQDVDVLLKLIEDAPPND